MSYFSSFVFSCLEVVWISRTGQPEEILNFAFLALVCSANTSLSLKLPFGFSHISLLTHLALHKILSNLIQEHCLRTDYGFGSKILIWRS